MRPKSKSSVEELLRQQVAAGLARQHPHSISNLKTTTTTTTTTATTTIIAARTPSKSLPKKIKSKVITSRTVQWPVLPQFVPPRLPTSPVVAAAAAGGKKAQQGSSFGELLKEKPLSRKATLAHEDVIRNRDLIFEVNAEGEGFQMDQ